MHRQLARMGSLWISPDYVREWSQEPRHWWGISYLRNVRNATKPAAVRLSIGERKARFPSRLRASRTLEQWLLKIEGGENAKAARVAAALIAALDSRVGHAESPFGNYFACREREGLISYCPSNRTQEITPEGKWARAGRVEIKPAKWARQILRHPEAFKDDEYAAFAEAFGGIEQGEKIEWKSLTTASEIDHAYDARNWGEDDKYQDPSGVNSCMWGESVGSFYERAGARLLVGVRRGLYVARAVVWETQELGTVVDRLYATPAIYEACRAYIVEQGWSKKEKDTNGSSAWIRADGSIFSGSLSVELARSVETCRFFPYLDSFRWQHGDVLRTRDDGDWDFEYALTSGGRDEGHHGQVQDIDGNWISEDDAYRVGGDYYHCDDERIVMCHYRDEYILREDAYEVSLGGRHGTVYLHENYVSRA